ncbi:MAG TPA: hypothetical protein VF035_06530 [Longimicrobiales bacterium]
MITRLYLRRTSLLIMAALSTACAARSGVVVPLTTDVRSAEQATTAYLASIHNDPVKLALFLRQMPKGGDLHSHLSGAVYAETFLRWAAEDGTCIELATFTLVRPPCDRDGRIAASDALNNGTLYGDVIDAWSMRNWHPAKEQNGHDQFFDTFGKFGLASGSARTADMLAEVAARAAAGNVSYLELMWTPSGSGASALGRATGLDADLMRTRDRLLQAGLRDSVANASRRLDTIFARQRAALGCATASPDPGCNVEVRVLYQVLRAIPPEQVFAHLVAAFEMAASDPRVVGFNMVQPEDDMVAMRDFRQQMRMIQALRPLYPAVRFTLHAGELAPGLVPPEGLRFHIRESVRVAGASRIGHGVDIAHEDSAVSLLQQMARDSILVEIALTSNAGILGIEGREHPLHLYMQYGVPVALATDDEGVSRSDMTHEYLRAVQDQWISYTALKRLAENSLRYSFADPATKSRLLAQLERDFAAFEASWSSTAASSPRRSSPD